MAFGTVLVVVSGTTDAARLLRAARRCVRPEGRLTALWIVAPSADAPLHDPRAALHAARAARRRLRQAISEAEPSAIPVTPRVCVSRLVEDAVREAVLSDESALLVLDAAALGVPAPSPERVQSATLLPRGQAFILPSAGSTTDAPPRASDSDTSERIRVSSAATPGPPQAWAGESARFTPAGASPPMQDVGSAVMQATAHDAHAAAIRRLVASPPCDTLLLRLGDPGMPQSVLLPSRGGPTATLALQVAQALSEGGTPLTMQHVTATNARALEREHEQRLFDALAAEAAAATTRTTVVAAPSPAEAVIAAARAFGVVVVGAQAGPPSGARLGVIPERLLAEHPGTVAIVKLRDPVDRAVFVPRVSTLRSRVETWVAERSYHCREFSDLDELAQRKRESGDTVSVAITLEADSGTLPGITRALLDLRDRYGLIDQIGVWARLPDPQTRAVAQSLSLPLHETDGSTPMHSFAQMAAQLTGDLLVWLDADIRNPHPRLVYGLIGPLLRDPQIQRVIGHTRLAEDSSVSPDDPLILLTDAAVRPLIELFYPELTGVVAPLSRHHAARRSAMIRYDAQTTASAELSLLLDQYELAGLDVLAQVDLEDRIGREPSADSVTRLTAAAVRTLIAHVSRRIPELARAIHVDEGDQS